MASNSYFDNATLSAFPKGQKARAEAVDAKFNSVTTGFDLLPTVAQFNRATLNFIATDTGAANAYAVSLSHVTSYEDGQEVFFIAANANTGPSTLDVETVGATTITNRDGTVLIADAIPADGITHIRYNAGQSRWELMGVTYDLSTAVTAFVATLLDDANAAEFMDTLGITTFVQTLLDDANAAAFIITLGITKTISQINSAALSVSYNVDCSTGDGLTHVESNWFKTRNNNTADGAKWRIENTHASLNLSYSYSKNGATTVYGTLAPDATFTFDGLNTGDDIRIIMRLPDLAVATVHVLMVSQVANGLVSYSDV